MKRHLEPVDLFVAIGVFATVIGGYFFFMAAAGTLEAGSVQTAAFGPSTPAVDPMEAMQWVQPALGQAIVHNELLARQAALETTQAVTELNRAMTKEQSLETAPYGHLERIAGHAVGMDADHAARVQYVAGRSIVTSTGRGVRAGVLSPSQVGDIYNRRIIDMTEATINGMEDGYSQMRDPMLGTAIVAAAQRHMEFVDQLQHRLGTAITRVIQVQDRFGEAIGEAQGQLGAVAVASLHAEQIAERFAQLAGADFGPSPGSVFSAPRAWPDIPIGALIATSATLVGLFVIGLFLPSAKPEAIPQVEAKPLPYRKTA
ncbi:MAG: hypothetical protein ACREJU_12295 [Nitrospiraceae bacterium]